MSKINLTKMKKSLSAIIADIEAKNTPLNTGYSFVQDDLAHCFYIDSSNTVYYRLYDIDEGGDYTNPSEMILNNGYYSHPAFDYNKIVKQTAIYILADSLTKKGYKHQAVLWALFNPALVPEGWELPYLGKEKSLSDKERQERYYDRLRKRLELQKFQSWALSICPGGLRTVEFENYSGVHGYTDYDFQNMQVTGYEVNCISSWQFGGNCNCINHDAGWEFSKEIIYEDIIGIKNIILTNSYKEFDEITVRK